MRALIMAGGCGTRLKNRGEKPLALVCNRPMLEYIADAFSAAGCEPVVVVTRKTPMTANWCRARGVLLVRAEGNGFVEDMVQAVRQLEEDGPVIVSVADIPCVTPATIRHIIDEYRHCGRDALSTWVPARLVQSCRGGMPYRKTIGGMEACPAGINILLGKHIDSEQDEHELLLDEPGLALNVNTPEDLARTESVLGASTQQDISKKPAR